MHVTGYELYEVPPRWVFLKIETSTGLIGWGEPVVEGYAKTTMAAVEELIDNYLIGKDPLEIERHWQAMYRGRHFRGGPILMSAISGIDQALWDIKGKHYNAPIYDLLGGRARDRIKVYDWIGGETPSEIRSSAADAIENGYTILKMAAVSQMNWIDSPEVVEVARQRLAAVRDEVGPGVDIAVDFRGRVRKAMTKWLASELDPYDPMLYEEPLLPEHFDMLAEVRNYTKTPLASGERLYSRWDFKQLLERDLVDVIQPDPSHAGGITETKKIANAAEAVDVGVALHCPLGPIAFATGIQLDTAIPNAFAQAQYLEVHEPTDNDLLNYLRDPTVFGFENGYVTPLEEPGLGIEIDEEYVQEQSELQINWQTPIWYHEDGSVGEW